MRTNAISWIVVIPFGIVLGVILYRWMQKKNNLNVIAGNIPTGSEEIPAVDRGSGDRSTTLYKQANMQVVPVGDSDVYVV